MKIQVFYTNYFETGVLENVYYGNPARRADYKRRERRRLTRMLHDVLPQPWRFGFTYTEGIR